MAFNGTGTFVRLYSWVTDALNGLFVNSTRMDADSNDIANGLSNCITKDGQTVVTANIPMAGFKFTGLAAGSAANDSARYSQVSGLANAMTCEFRLTLTAGVPVTTADVTGAGTVYITPCRGNHVALYDGAAWNMRAAVEGTVGSLAALSASTIYDVFLFDLAGVVQGETAAWTNDTTRATALVLQDGVLVKSGATTRRYIGSFRLDGSKQANDSYALRHVWNYYNRVRRPMRVVEATNTWNYTTATIRQANGSTANQLDFVMGYGEDMVSAEVEVMLVNGSAGVNVVAGIGLDTTTAFTSGGVFSSPATAANVNLCLYAALKTFPGVGRHFMSWNEYSAATGTTTWFGDNGGTLTQAGITGELWG